MIKDADCLPNEVEYVIVSGNNLKLEKLLIKFGN